MARPSTTTTTTTTTKETCVWLRHCQEETRVPVPGVVTGEVPEWLEGRVTRNGPGQLKVGTTHYHHLFDALAMLHQFHISRGAVTYHSRFLESDSFKKNHAADRIVVSEFGTGAYPDLCGTLFSRFRSSFTIPTPKKMSDNCLVSVCQVKDEMLALTETCYVRKVDPKTLETLGKKICLTDHIAVNLATAHPHIEADGTLYNMGSSFTSSKGPCYNVVRLPEGRVDGAKVVASVPCQWRMYPSYFHSFAMTERYWVLVEQPLVLSSRKIVMGSLVNRPPMDSLMWLPEYKTKFRVIERASGRVLKTVYTADAFATFHHVNAWDQDGQLVLDLCGTDDGDVIKMLLMSNLAKEPADPTRLLFRSYLRRYVLPITDAAKSPSGENLVRVGGHSCTAVKKQDGSIHLTPAKLYNEFFDMPRINYSYNCSQYRYTYGVSTMGNDLVFEQLVKIDVVTGESWRFHAEDHTVSEPIFVAAPGATREDDGVVLSTLLRNDDVGYVAMVVLDAKDMTQLAKVEFTADGVVTPSFHGQFVGTHDTIHAY